MGGRGETESSRCGEEGYIRAATVRSLATVWPTI